MSEKLKPCPFCGSKARMLGGPMAQERYSVWCENRHHIIGGSDANKLALEWNTRHVPEGYALVPVEPTQQQKHAAESEIANWCSSSRQSRHHQIADRVYRTMIAAAQEQNND